MNKVDVFEFESPVKFLKEVYKRNNVRAKFSYRTISRYLDINLSIVHGIFNGDRTISPGNIKKFSKLLKLSRSEKEYFEFIVYVSQSNIPKKIKSQIFMRGY